MTVRAIWKGVLVLADLRLPVRLYAAVVDRGIHFRMLHEADHHPLEQRLVNPQSGEQVPRQALRRGHEIKRGRFVVITDEELDATRPEPSRDIELLGFIPPDALAPGWYDRPYWLGPDGATQDYFALAQALAQEDREGVASWVMRGKRYAGALRAQEGCLALVTLHHAAEVVPASALPPPTGRDFERRERAMANKLIESLEGDFEPRRWHDDYRQRVLELVAAKARGEAVEPPRQEGRPRPGRSLGDALEQSLDQAG